MYISLLQTHLPSLDEHGIVTYDPNSKRVERRDAVDQVMVYMEAGAEDGTDWSERYLWVAILGLVTGFAAAIDVPIVSVLPPVYWTVFCLGVIGGTAAYRNLVLSSEGRTR